MFTPAQQTAIFDSARPLNSHERDAYIAAVHVYFRGRTEVGDGELGRALRELQQEHRQSLTRDYPSHLFK